MSGRVDVSELLSAYLDGELDGDERSRVDDALAASPDLRRELAELDGTRSLLRRLPDVEPRRPIARPQADRSVRGGRRSRRLAVAATAVAAVWLVILSVGVSIGSLPVVPDVDQLALQHAAAEDGADMGFQPMTVDQMADDPVVLDDIGHGMVRESIFQSDDVVQVRYSDGVHAVSVFHQPGEVDWGDMPDMGTVEMMDDGPVWVSTMDDVDVLVAERGDLVITVVADGDMDQEMTMMASTMVPEVDMDESLWSRVVDAPANVFDRF